MPSEIPKSLIPFEVHGQNSAPAPPKVVSTATSFKADKGEKFRRKT